MIINTQLAYISLETTYMTYKYNLECHRGIANDYVWLKLCLYKHINGKVLYKVNITD